MFNVLISIPYHYAMFIREVKIQRSKDSKTFFQYNLVQTSRIDRIVKQKVILYLDQIRCCKTKRIRK